MKQSRTMSLVESVANIGVGYGIAVVAQVVVFPLFGIEVGFGEHLAIGTLFTIVSVVRSFMLRRIFEAIRVRST